MDVGKPIPQGVKDVTSAVWKTTDGRGYTGAAFAIAPESSRNSTRTNRFITNAHLLRYASRRDELTLSQEGSSRRLKVHRVLAISITYDLALLETTEAVSSYVELDDSLSEGEEGPFYGIGYRQRSFTYLRPVSDSVYEDNFFYAFATHQTDLGGSSGGPILNSQGQVVAISGITVNANIIYGLKVKYINQFLSQGPREIGVDCFWFECWFLLSCGLEKDEGFIR